MVGLRPSRDLVADPADHPALGRPENLHRWLSRNPDLAALDGPLAFRLFMTIAQFPAMRASQLTRIAGGPSAQVRPMLEDFVATGLVARLEERHYLAQQGMRRAATLSRVSPSVIQSRHGAYLEPWYRRHELAHNDGVNRLVARFSRQGVAAVAGWRGEVNVPDVTQVRPDLLVPVVAGPHGGGFHFLEYERTVSAWQADIKLRPYRRMAQLGRALPALFVCEDPAIEDHFLSAGGFPLLTATTERALAGPSPARPPCGAVPPASRWLCTANSGQGGAGSRPAASHRC